MDMSKTPDDIKKGLACCAASIYQCADDCPYREGCRSGEGWIAMNKDALSLIQQLEAERDAALEDKRGECTYCAFLPGETIPETCFDCANKGYYRWEWRGVQKEE